MHKHVHAIQVLCVPMCMYVYIYIYICIMYVISYLVGVGALLFNVCMLADLKSCHFSHPPPPCSMLCAPRAAICHTLLFLAAKLVEGWRFSGL